MEFNEAWNDTCSSVGMASRLGDVLLLRKLIDAGKPIDVADNRGWLPLHEAAAKNNYKCLEQLLLHEYIDINRKNHEGETALFLAAAQNNYECVKLLLESGANTDLTNNAGMTALIAASSDKNVKSVRLLLQSDVDVNTKDIDEWTAVHYAAKAGSVKILQMLYKCGASMWAQEEHGRNSIFIAAQHNNLECVKYLINLAKDLNEINVINTPALDNTTALGIAAQNGDYDCLVFLLENNADPNYVTRDGYTALHLAADVSRDKKCVELLLNKIDVNILRQHSKTSCIQFAVMDKNYGLIKTWLEKQLSPDAHGDAWLHLEYSDRIVDTRLRTPLAIAAEIRDELSVEMLLSGGANTERLSKRFVSPLVAAIVGGNREIVKMILRASDLCAPYCKSCNHEALRTTLIKEDWITLELLLKSGFDDKRFYQYSTVLYRELPKQKSEVIENLMPILWKYVERDVWLKMFNLLKIHDFGFGGNPLLKSTLISLAGQPHKLLHLCRLQMRATLKECHRCSIYKIDFKQLNLPEILNSYILYEN